MELPWSFTSAYSSWLVLILGDTVFFTFWLATRRLDGSRENGRVVQLPPLIDYLADLSAIGYAWELQWSFWLVGSESRFFPTSNTFWDK